MHSAISRRKTERALALIEAGADVHALNSLKSTPLLVAASLSEEAVSLALIARGAKLEAIDRVGRTPLLVNLARGGALFESLMAAGANPYAVDRSGENAFHRVCASGHHEWMPRLCELKVDAHLCNTAGQTPLALAIAHGALAGILGFMACGFEVDDASRAAVPPALTAIMGRVLSANRLEAAVELDDPEFLWWVLSQAVDFEEAGPEGAAILAYAEAHEVLRSVAVIRAWQFRSHTTPSRVISGKPNKIWDVR